MTPTKILIVEADFGIVEILIAKLYGKGYLVCGVAAEGETAIEKAKTETPDLVLMDIVLKGDMDGIQAADRIRSEVGAPVVYLTARIGGEMLERAKVTEPYGFIMKPINDDELLAAIEMGLYKAGQDRIARDRELIFRTIADSSPDWEFWIGPDDLFLYNSPSCETITGFSKEDFDKNPYLFFEIAHEKDQKRLASFLKKTKKSKKPFELEYRIATSSGEEKWIGLACVPVYSRSGDWEGVRGTNRDITAARKVGQGARNQTKPEGPPLLAGETALDIKYLFSEIRGHIEAARIESESPARLAEHLEKAASACVEGEKLSVKHANSSGRIQKRKRGLQ